MIIAGAGGAAHLPGMLAAVTPLPVIGVPVPLKYLDGLDSLLSIVQMPAGIPVATVAVGGARNAGLLAVRILAAADDALRARMVEFQAGLAAQAQAKGAAPLAPTSRAADDFRYRFGHSAARGVFRACIRGAFWIQRRQLGRDWLQVSDGGRGRCAIGVKGVSQYGFFCVQEPSVPFARSVQVQRQARCPEGLGARAAAVRRERRAIRPAHAATMPRLTGPAAGEQQAA